MKPSSLSSWVLVGAQLALIVLLVATTQPLRTTLANWTAFALVLLGTFVGVAALAANRPGNFNVQPEIKADARLVTDGIYARVRHPMYLAVLLVMLASVAADPRAWRVLAWLALLAVLLAKARREERLLTERFAGYGDYMRRTRRLLPGLY